ncbi:DnaJ-domain-containing protein [Athelia psychrophila]|uniref:DnaJ-domain-containing protein n=1 Tax=Athelia psychrophila TaxID=1759441 RepID=A0A166NNQ8_9AGAM|nr:DnaJ-domain-containing protein [Fibularhizoctonia sp. CBS 109695]
MSAQASSSKPEPNPTPAISDAELEKLLNREASAFQRDVEVERILKAFKLNPYDVLDISELSTPEEIKRRYRQLSLFIHPDKCAHVKAPEAFDLLKKAESELSEAPKRADLDAVILEARVTLLREFVPPLPVSTLDSDSALTSLGSKWKSMMRTKSKELLIEEEVRRRKAVKMNLANEGLEAKKKEDEVNGRKRKAEEDKSWEANRDQRVDSWRSFAKGGKKKKSKIQVLG